MRSCHLQIDMLCHIHICFYSLLCLWTMGCFFLSVYLVISGWNPDMCKKTICMPGSKHTFPSFRILFGKIESIYSGFELCSRFGFSMCTFSILYATNSCSCTLWLSWGMIWQRVFVNDCSTLVLPLWIFLILILPFCQQNK